ncbi:MAG: thioredoxin [Selenomonadaceae bacterium]|nr:thioredoxin [Selenomonadaceae bacterium]
MKLRIALLIVAALSIAFGAWRGEGDAVYNKAIRVCMECIGLG